MPVNSKIQIRKGTTSDWNSANPVLASGEPGYDTTNGGLKIGNGSLSWNQLNYIGVLGTGTSNFIAKFTANQNLGNSLIFDNGTNVGIGTAAPSTKLDVSGVVTATGGNSTNWNTSFGWGNHASAGYQSASTSLTTSTNFGGDVSGAYNNIVVADDSHNHIISNVDGLQTALDLKAPLSSPTLTGTPSAPTATGGTNTTQIATTAFVRTEISSLVDAAPGTLDTLNELAAALGDDPNFATTVTNSIATKANTNQTMFIGTTAVVINRASASLSLAGVSIDGNAGTATTSTTITASGGLTTQQGTGTVGYVSPIVNGTTGLFPGANNANSVLTLNRHPGNYYSQLGFSSNNNLYYRAFNNVAIDTTTAWQTLWTSSSLTNLNQLTNGPGYTTNVGTVTSVAALTLTTTGTDVSSTVASGTTTPIITLNIPTASASNRGALSSADWTTFSNKQNALTNPVTGTGTNNYISKWTGTTTQGNSIISDDGTTSTIGTVGGTRIRIEGIGGANAVSEYYSTESNPRWQIGRDLIAGGLAGIGFATSSTIAANGAAVGLAANKELGLYSSNGSSLVERVRITTAGNVGIGMDNPSERIHVSGAQTTIRLNNSLSYDTQLRLTDTASDWSVGINQGNTLGSGVFSIRSLTAGATRLVINTSGNVGIGTTAPITKLDIKVPHAEAYGTLHDVINLNAYFPGYSENSQRAGIQAGVPNLNNTTYGWIGLATNGADGYNTRMVVNANGNVGIGTITPGEKLDVNGNIRLAANGKIYFGVTGTNTQILDDSGSNRTVLIARGNVFDILNAAGNTFSTTLRTGVIAGGTAATNSLVLKSTTGVGTTDYISLAVGNNGSTEAVRVINNGNIGIGTSTPTYKLQVNGSFAASTKSFRIDHPSKKDYSLEYGSLESPYHGVRLTGRGKVIKGTGVVSVPPYLKDLIHDDDTLNIQITNIKHGKIIYVDEIDLNNDRFTVKVDRAKTVGDLEFFWVFTGVRKDVPNLVVEKPKGV